jgi:hypothetical protein
MTRSRASWISLLLHALAAGIVCVVVTMLKAILKHFPSTQTKTFVIIIII